MSIIAFTALFADRFANVSGGQLDNVVTEVVGSEVLNLDLETMAMDEIVDVVYEPMPPLKGMKYTTKLVNI